MGKNVSGFSETALAKLEAHHWPGNVRELENAVKRSIVKCSSDAIDACDILLGESPAPAHRDALWADILAGKHRIADLTDFRNQHGEHVLKDILTRALHEKPDIRAAGKLIGFLNDFDDKKGYENLRQWLSRLGISLRDIKRS